MKTSLEWETREFEQEEDQFIEEDIKLQAPSPPDPKIGEKLAEVAEVVFMFPLGALNGAMSAIQS